MSEKSPEERIKELEQQLEAAHTEMQRIGYGVEKIFVFKQDGTPNFTSKVGDECWDTAENRRLAFEFIAKHSDKFDALRREYEARLRRRMSDFGQELPEAERPRNTTGRLRHLEEKCIEAHHLAARSWKTGPEWIYGWTAPGERQTNGARLLWLIQELKRAIYYLESDASIQEAATEGDKPYHFPDTQ